MDTLMKKYLLSIRSRELPLVNVTLKTSMKRLVTELVSKQMPCRSQL